ncbi:MAG TPA: isoprenoid biosynthesis glyoxalase ElbB [Abditibacteriaceae bacterium]|nr:isoprenoid biosynthesis glyoxalase ElbB [Abditibacteriaceae bacterium]
MPRVGVLLAGCGVEDGSEIYEAVLTILALERGGATVQALAPDIEQAENVNHYRGYEERTGELGGVRRSVLSESARIVRGKITSTREVSAHDLDALIIPGGYGVTKNLCTYARDGDNATVDDDVERLIREIAGLGKPIGALCAGPILVALALRDRQPTLTIGSDATTALGLTRLGAQHHVTGVADIYVDTKNNIVSTPAFMLAQSVSEAEPGITKLVNQVLEMTKAMARV